MEKKTDLKALSGKGKIEYIWDYYKWHIIITICVAAMLGSIIHHYATYEEPLLNVIMVNNLDATSTVDGFDEFFASCGIEADDNAVSLSSGLYFSEEGQALDPNDTMLLSTLIISGGQDLFFGTGKAFTNHADHGALADLSTLLPEDVLEAYKDQLIYSTNNGETASYPCAIELTDNEWLAKNHYYETCYFGIFQQSANPKLAVQFAMFLLNY